MKAVIVILALVGFAQATNFKDVLKAEFKSFKVKHGKIYKDIYEELQRMQIFKDNMVLIERHNKRFAAGEETYEMGVNHFTDMSASEFKRLMLTNMTTDYLKEDIDNIYNVSARAGIPSGVDWRYSGAVPPVKDQGSCGSCWAFSAIGALESHHFLKKGQRVSLSEQNLVDCTRQSPYYNSGCVSGWTDKAYEYIRDNGGINTASYYPYQDKENSCRYNRNYIGSKISGYVTIPRGNEYALASAVANEGPVSVCIDSSHFQFYKGGVFNNPSCSKNTNHCVVVDGYGTDKFGGDYWLARNSWGPNWGQNGYIRMARNRNNQCSIASYAYYPLVV
ncbi:cathepsin L1-like [Drosophila innubila]|uniref:cathepsin L1-like n=1 Tax=Drosophila innubila TaxID=198719 RepID=UPI00148B82B3|nr:cathepsin L1-like [Drosophila innubila]